LQVVPVDKPIAIVEAPKTAVIASALIPAFVWLAVGGKSYLNAERLASIKSRRIILYPDLNAYNDWSRRAEQLRAKGFIIEVSDFLECHASEEQQQAGLDIADYLLQQPPTVTTIAEQLAWPGSILKPDESAIERLRVEPCDTYPPEWDEPNPPDRKPVIRAKSLDEWLSQDKKL
jgi:hypothetical protein